MKEPQLAFPVIGTITGKPNALGQQQMMGIYQSGMTLRDFFASAALRDARYPTFENWENARTEQMATVAKFCYEIADAMIAERDRMEVSNGK